MSDSAIVLGFVSTKEQREKLETIREACNTRCIRDHNFDTFAGNVSKTGVLKAAYDEGMKVLFKRHKKELAKYRDFIERF